MAKLPAICIQGFLWKFGTQALAEKHEISLGPGASVDCIALMSPGPEGLYGLTMAAMASWDMTPKKLWRYGYGRQEPTLLSWALFLSVALTVYPGFILYCQFLEVSGCHCVCGHGVLTWSAATKSVPKFNGDESRRFAREVFKLSCFRTIKIQPSPPANWCGWCD